ARDSIRPVAGGLAALFALFALAHPFTLRAGAGLRMSMLASATAAGLGSLWLVLGRRPLSPRRAHAAGAAIAFVVLANCLAHVYVTAELWQTTNLLLLLVGAGALFVS